MKLPSTVSAATALLALYLAISNANSFAVERFKQHRWFVLLALSACFYSLPNVVLALEVSDATILAASRISVAAAAVHVFAWMQYAEADLEPLPRRWRLWLSAGLLAQGALYTLPGVGLTGRVLSHPSELLGAVYHAAEPSPIGGAIFLLLMLGLVLTLLRYARGARRGVPHARAHTAALVVLLCGAASDSAVTLGFSRAPYVLDLAFFISVAIVGLVMSRRWAEDVETLGSALRARDEFVSIASHELKTPLSPLILQVQMLQRWADAQSDERARLLRPRLALMERQVLRFSRLVNELLDVSRIEAGRLRLELETVDLSAVVREAAARLARPELAVEADGAVTGQWDQLRLEQVAINLLDNALKYGGGKPVTVRVTAEGDEAVLAVQDLGIGIAAADQPRLFGRFERGVGAQKIGGLGLGLYITRQIVTAHGGTIAFTSLPGEGTTFTVRLPTGGGARSSG